MVWSGRCYTFVLVVTVVSSTTDKDWVSPRVPEEHADTQEEQQPAVLMMDI